MYPDPISVSMRADKKRVAEVRVYEALAHPYTRTGKAIAALGRLSKSSNELLPIRASIGPGVAPIEFQRNYGLAHGTRTFFGATFRDPSAPATPKQRFAGATRSEILLRQKREIVAGLYYDRGFSGFRFENSARSSLDFASRFLGTVTRIRTY